VRLVDEDVGVQVGRVHPIAAEVLGQPATRLHHFCFDRRNAQTLRTLLGRLQRVALSRDGDADVEVVVSVLQKAPVLFILSRFFCVGHGEKVVLLHKPSTQATVLHHYKIKNLL